MKEKKGSLMRKAKAEIRPPGTPGLTGLKAKAGTRIPDLLGLIVPKAKAESQDLLLKAKAESRARTIKIGPTNSIGLISHFVPNTTTRTQHPIHPVS